MELKTAGIKLGLESLARRDDSAKRTFIQATEESKTSFVLRGGVLTLGEEEAQPKPLEIAGEGEVMTFEEYRTDGRVRYAAFVDAIRHILGAGADAHKLVPHAITGRAKAPKSLLKKLEDRKIDPDSDIAAALKDLAGARIV